MKSTYPYMAFVPVILKFLLISFANASARLAALSALCDTSLSINTTTLAPSRRNQSNTCMDATLFKVQRGSSPWMVGNLLGGIGVYSSSPYVGRFWHFTVICAFFGSFGFNLSQYVSLCYDSHGPFSFLLTPLLTHCSHTYSTSNIVLTLTPLLTHCSHTYSTPDSLFSQLLHYDSSTPIVLLLYIWLDTHL